jgi:hypothetical protein
MIWIIDNQVSRRSIPKYWRAALVVKKEDLFKKIGKANMGLSPGRPPKEEPDWLKKPLVGSGKLLPPLERKAKKGLPNLVNLNTQKQLSEEAGVSKGTFHKIAKIEKEGSEDLKKRCMNEEISVDAAYKELRGLNSDEPPAGDMDKTISKTYDLATEIFDHNKELNTDQRESVFEVVEILNQCVHEEEECIPNMPTFGEETGEE